MRGLTVPYTQHLMNPNHSRLDGCSKAQQTLIQLFKKQLFLF